MSLFAGLGLLGMVALVDSVQTSGYRKVRRRLESEFGPYSRESTELFTSIGSYGTKFYGRSVITFDEANAIKKLYIEYGIGGGEAGMRRDVAILSAREFGFEYSGANCNILTMGQMNTMDNIKRIGIIGYGASKKEDFETADSVHQTYYYKLKKILENRFGPLPNEFYRSIERSLEEEKKRRENGDFWEGNVPWIKLDGSFDREGFEKAKKELEEKETLKERVNRVYR